MINFSLKIDDKNHSLNSENGISIDLIGKLLEELYKTIDLNEGAKCTLSNIRGNCYALDFSTESIIQAERFKIVHQKIQDVPIQDLDKSERDYAKTLKKIMSDRFWINAYSNGEKIASINKIIEGKSIKYYFSQKTIYGFLSELGGKSLESSTKHIIVDGFPHRINISKDLDLQLKPYYRTDKLAFKIKTRHSFEKGSIISAEMISFKQIGANSFSENLKEEGHIPLNILNNKATMDGIIDALYGDS
tara:strand:+ start:814 stop:1554 length:741 start_codon:yes stop_codon:yes gene_type:complete